MNAVWEEVVVETFEDNFKKLPVKNFIIAHREVVELFIAKEDLEHLATCNSEGKDPKMDVLRRVLTWSRLARSQNRRQRHSALDVRRTRSQVASRLLLLLL